MSRGMVRDAMGANTVNTLVESVSPLVEKISGGVVRLRILSNLADRIGRQMADEKDVRAGRALVLLKAMRGE